MGLMPTGDGEYDSHPAIWLRALVAEMPLGGFLLELHSGYRDRLQVRAGDFLEEVAKQVDKRFMRDRLQNSEQLESVFWRCMRSAADSTHEGKRRLLSHALANAFLEDAKVDEADLLERMLATVDTVHIAALARLRQAEQNAREEGGLPDRVQYAERPIVDALRNAGEREHPLVLGVLTTQGLIDVSSGFGGGEAMFRGVTQIGATLLQDLNHVSD